MVFFTSLLFLAMACAQADQVYFVTLRQFSNNGVDCFQIVIEPANSSEPIHNTPGDYHLVLRDSSGQLIYSGPRFGFPDRPPPRRGTEALWEDLRFWDPPFEVKNSLTVTVPAFSNASRLEITGPGGQTADSVNLSYFSNVRPNASRSDLSRAYYPHGIPVEGVGFWEKEANRYLADEALFLDVLVLPPLILLYLILTYRSFLSSHMPRQFIILGYEFEIRRKKPPLKPVGRE